MTRRRLWALAIALSGGTSVLFAIHEFSRPETRSNVRPEHRRQFVCMALRQVQAAQQDYAVLHSGRAASSLAELAPLMTGDPATGQAHGFELTVRSDGSRWAALARPPAESEASLLLCSSGAIYECRDLRSIPLDLAAPPGAKRVADQ